MAKSDGVKDKIAEGYILARIIVEVIGSPKEHVEKVLGQVVEEFKDHENIKLVKEHKEPAEKAEEEQFFHAFTELEFLAKDVYALVGVCIDLTPSSVEVIEPSEIKMTAKDMSGFLNDFAQKLHRIGISSKNASAQAQLMRMSFDAVLLNMVILLVRAKPQNLDSLSKYTGVKKDLLKVLLTKFVKDNKIAFENDLYSIKKK